MSNHSGSYILNEVLLELEQRQFFAKMAPSDFEAFMDKISSLIYEHDCNAGEVTDEGFGDRMNFCYHCWKLCERVEDGSCFTCTPEELRR